MKVYTGAGDKGKTSLFSGQRVLKNDIQVQAYGELDELNAIVGVLAASIANQDEEIIGKLKDIQSDLLHIGSWLATHPDSPAVNDLTPLTSTLWEKLERRIDKLESVLPELKDFILPGGMLDAAVAHFARTVCRRVERQVLNLMTHSDDFSKLESIPHILTYLNRLSDYFFVLARYLNFVAGKKDLTWRK